MALAMPCLISNKVFGASQILWDESVNGDLSDYYYSPSILPSLVQGSNYIIGSVVILPTPYGADSYPDNFNLTVPAGFQIKQIILSSDTPNALWIWIGNTAQTQALGFWGGTFNSSAPENGDLLSQISLPPIQSGDYGMYVANMGAAPSTNQFQINFWLVPTPCPLNIQRVDDSIVLTWTNSAFYLQRSQTITGTYTNVVGATSPFTNLISGASAYFRLNSN